MNYNPALIQLPLVREARGDPVRTPDEVYNVCRDLADLAQETFHVLSLDVRNRLINRHMVSLGLANASLVHPREVFRQAIGQDGAIAVILTHNHPTGQTTPSAEDLRVTRQLIQAGEILDVKVLDHVIIGRAGNDTPPFLSMREAGLCKFE